MEIEAYRTPIQSFYAGQTIFITGGLGFLGSVLIEKLLRSCPDISTIYLLIRSKKGECIKNRFEDLWKEPLYDRVRKEVPNFRQKIALIKGDINIEDFGLSENDQNLLINEKHVFCITTSIDAVTIIFHIAASMRFDEEIKISTLGNVNAVATILKLAKRMPNLKSFIHMSTIYSNSHVQHIDERFYLYPINHNDLMMLTRNLSENTIKEKISRIISQWPNTYTFTKAIAEGLLKHESDDLPIGIFRPAIVISTASEPLVGWINNIYGPVGFVITSLLGIKRFDYFNTSVKANIVPVDFTINALIASAWDVSNQCRKDKQLIYNFVSPIDRPTWNEYAQVLFDTNKKYPLRKAIYFPFLICFQHKIPYKICICLGHLLPALLMDAASICLNRRPRMWKLYKKIHKLSKLLYPWSINEWNISSDNVQALWSRLSKKDQELFKFSMVGFNWTEYLIDHYKGIRLYLLKEDDSTLEISRIKYKRFYWIHQTLKIVFIFAILWIVWIVFKILSSTSKAGNK